MKKIVSFIIAFSILLQIITPIETMANTANSNNVPDYDIFMADILMSGMEGNGSIYKAFNQLQEPVYKDLGEKVLDDKSLVSLSTAWTVFFNSEYRSQFANEQKYIYEIILMDYLKFGMSDRFSTEGCIDKEFNFTKKLYFALVEDVNNSTVDYINNNMSIEEAEDIWKDANDLNELNTAIDQTKEGVNTVKELIEEVSIYMTLKETKNDTITLLKASKDAAGNNKDYINAVNDIIKALNSTEWDYIKGRSIKWMLNEGVDKAWDELKKANPVLKAIDIGVSGLDVCFDTTQSASNNLKIVLLYIIDSYMHAGLSNSMQSFASKKTSDNAIKFRECFEGYVKFQMFGNDYASNWIDQYLDGGALQKLFYKSFNKNNVKTAQDIQNLCQTQINSRVRLLSIMDTYSDIYMNKYSIPIKLKIGNPRIVKDSSMVSGQLVTWDCIYFGSYPQAEVVKSTEDYGAVDLSYLEQGDLIEDAALFAKLENATAWDNNNDTVIDGNKYRRIKRGDATVFGINDFFPNHYRWKGDYTSYHYFKYEPIKWRVLEVNNTSALILADKIIDCRKYNEEHTSVFWENCDIRKWLNNEFYKTVFNEEEKNFIMPTNVINKANRNWGTDNEKLYGGNDTIDNVFLLSEDEAYGEKCDIYGFSDSEDIGDWARRCKCTTFAKAMGMDWLFKCYEGQEHCSSWWLRSPGRSSSLAAYIDEFGGTGGSELHIGAGSKVESDYGIRPALKINLQSINASSFAGSVSSSEHEIHTYKTTTTKAKPGTNGSVVKTCTVCKDEVTVSTIYAPKTIALSVASYTYNGKQRKPKVTVKDSKGNVIAPTNYTVTYTNNINAGTTKTKPTVKVTFKGDNYTGYMTQTFTINKANNKLTGTAAYTKTASTKAQSFKLNMKATGGKVTYKSNNKNVKVDSKGKVTIAKNFSGRAVITVTAGNNNYKTVTKKVTITAKPAATTLKSVKNSTVKNASKGKLTIAWNKLSYVTGYQIQYSASSSFKSGNKTVDVKGASNVSKAITGLAKNKIYYVRIRTYKTIAGKNVFSAWSAKKSVKIK